MGLPRNPLETHSLAIIAYQVGSLEAARFHSSLFIIHSYCHPGTIQDRDKGGIREVPKQIFDYFHTLE